MARVFRRALIAIGSAMMAATVPVSAWGQEYRPSFHPETLKGPPAGKPNEVLVLGTAHLSGLPANFKPELLAPLLTRLAAWRPTEIATEDLSGLQCDSLRRYPSRYAATVNDYCYDPTPAGQATGLDVPAANAEALATKLLENPDVLPIGLGARDSLRLEAGLCLYGHDIDTTTMPAEAALEWSVQKSRRIGGARAGGFPGADIILKQFETGASRRRVGLRAEGRAPVREHAALYASETSSEKIGTVTSGGFGPTLNAPVAMGYLPTSLSTEGTLVFADVRGQRLPLRVSTMPFVPNGYKR